VITGKVELEKGKMSDVSGSWCCVNEILTDRHAELPARSLDKRGFGISK